MTNNINKQFSWCVLDYLPDEKEIIQFPRNPLNYSEGYIIQVDLGNGKEWVGNFQGIDKHYFSGVLLWPKRNHICVVALGRAYVVQTDTPDNYEELSVVPIIYAQRISDLGILIFATFWDIFCFGESGLLWNTQNLAIDGIEIDNITNEFIYGISKGYNKEVFFTLDIHNGKTLDDNY